MQLGFSQRLFWMRQASLLPLPTRNYRVHGNQCMYSKHGRGLLYDWEIYSDNIITSGMVCCPLHQCSLIFLSGYFSIKLIKMAGSNGPHVTSLIMKIFSPEVIRYANPWRVFSEMEKLGKYRFILNSHKGQTTNYFSYIYLFVDWGLLFANPLRNTYIIVLLYLLLEEHKNAK